jgi:Fic family protein
MTVGGKSITETLEAKNHPEAIKFVERLVDAKSELSEDIMLQLHKLIMSNITEEAGHYRITGVKITGATFMPPPSSQVKPRIDGLLKWLRENPDELTPIELAAIFHHRFVQIHPFSEGNGRTARLLMNALLMKAGYPFIATVPKLDRPKYLRTLSEADSGNTSSFVNFIARCAEKALDMYLDALEEPEILALAEASKITPYSQEYLSLLARKGLLGAYKQGRNWVVSRRELDRYLMSVRRESTNSEEQNPF